MNKKEVRDQEINKELKALKSIMEVINNPLVTSCCGVPVLYYLGTFGAEEWEMCPSCLECPEVEPEIKDPAQELQFKKLNNAQFEFVFNGLLYYVTIESPENLGINAPPIICLDIFKGKLKTGGPMANQLQSYNFDNLHDLGHELHYSQDLGPQLTTYITEEIQKGGLID